FFSFSKIESYQGFSSLAANTFLNFKRSRFSPFLMTLLLKQRGQGTQNSISFVWAIDSSIRNMVSQ
ncbi:MAG: hypothetical protein JW702_08020, partial [Clostridiales bacterium]|nr:hypothetical protein [Clostridiales bacterium]